MHHSQNYESMKGKTQDCLDKKAESMSHRIAMIRMPRDDYLITS